MYVYAPLVREEKYKYKRVFQVTYLSKVKEIHSIEMIIILIESEL